MKGKLARRAPGWWSREFGEMTRGKYVQAKGNSTCKGPEDGQAGNRQGEDRKLLPLQLYLQGEWGPQGTETAWVEKAGLGRWGHIGGKGALEVLQAEATEGGMDLQGERWRGAGDPLGSSWHQAGMGEAMPALRG